MFRPLNLRSLQTKYLQTQILKQIQSDDNIFALPAPSYVIPQRRNNKNKMEQGLQRMIDKSTISSNRGRINNVSNNIDSSTAISIHQDSQPNMTADSQSNNNVDNSQVSTVLDNTQPSVSLNNTGGSQVQDSVRVDPPVQPRHSGRVRQPPDRYDEWVTNQHTALNPETTQIWYVQ